MKLNRFATFIVALAAMMLVGSSIALAADYAPPSGSGSAGSDAMCIAEGGDTGFVYEGDLSDIDATNAFAGVDFYWQGVGENWTLLDESAVFENAYPDILNGTYWLYPYATCSYEQARALFDEHVEARMMDAEEAGHYVSWQESGVFFPVETDAYTAPVETEYVDPEPVMEQVVVNSPVTANGASLCPTDENVYGDLLRVCVDEVNPAVMPGNCFVHQVYLQEGGPEISTAGSYVSVRWTNNQSMTQWALGHHGIWNVASRLPDNAEVTEYGVNCTFNEVYALLAADIQAYSGELAATPLVSFYETKMFGLEDDSIPYFGGTVDPDTDQRCHAEKQKGGIMERRQKVGRDGFYTLVEPWAPGLAPEHNSVLDPGEYQLRNNVHGSFWYYDADKCTRGEVVAQAKAQSNRRKNHGNAGFFQNPNRYATFFVKVS